MAESIGKFIAIVNSCHPVPCLAVSSFAGMFAYGSGISIARCLWIFLAVLFHQLSVGFSNDWLDFKIDEEAKRVDKATVSGLVSVTLLKYLAIYSAAIAEVITLPLGLWATLLMLVMLVVGWAYNLGMKSNWSSVIPYALGFGAIPLFVGLTAPNPFLAPTWTILVAALLGVSAHFANVLPDILADKLTGVNALPHILGQRVSALVIAGTALLASSIVLTQSTKLPAAITGSGLGLIIVLVLSASILSLKPKPPRMVFPLLMLTALMNVLLLVLGSSQI